MTRYLLALLCVSCVPTEGAGIPGPAGPPGPMGAMGVPGTGSGVSGDRVKIRYMTTTDGLRLAWGLYDSMRMEECSMQEIEARYYCLPKTSPTPAAYYLDQQCSMRAVMTTATEKYLSEGGRSDPFRIYPLEVATPKPAFLYSGQPGSCAKTPAIPDQANVYRLGPALALTEFAEGTLAAP